MNRKNGTFEVKYGLAILWVILISASTATAQSLYSYETVKVREDIYLLKAGELNGNWVTGNIVIVINENDVLVVDSGFLPSLARLAVAEIRKLTPKPVKYLVNTHWHGDHWQGNEVFIREYPSLEIIATDEALVGMKTKGTFWYTRRYAKIFEDAILADEQTMATGKLPDGKEASLEALANLKMVLPDRKKELSEIKNLKPVFPTVTFNKNMTLKRGQREIQLHYLGWGNTTGDGIVYLPHEKILITGDLVVYPSQYESGSFSREWLDVYKKLSEFEFSQLLPGHGPVQNDKEYLSFLIALFEEIIAQVNEVINDGETLEQVQKRVTHESVTAQLLKNVKNKPYVGNLDNRFVFQAVARAYYKAREGKL
jgi:cyclase